MVKPILNRIFQGLFFTCFIWIYVSIIFTNSGDRPWLSALLGIGFMGLGIGVTLFCTKVVSRWKLRTIHLIFVGISLVILVLLFYFGFSLKASYGWDIYHIYELSISGLGEAPELEKTYLSICPNNIFLYILLKVYYKIIFAITGSTSSIYAIILTIFFIWISIIFIYLIAIKLWGAHIGLLTSIICLFFAPFYTYASQYYTDTLSLPFVVIPIYLYLCAISNEKSIIKYSLFTGAGIIFVLGFKLKGSIAIILIAMFMHLFLSQKVFIALKNIGTLLVTFIIIFFSYNAIVNQLNIITEDELNANERPYTHYLMMGLQNNESYGGYSAEDSNFTASFPTLEERKNANIEEAKKRIANFGFTGLINHFINKAVHNTWGDGTYFVFGEASTIPETNSRLWELFQFKHAGTGKYYGYFYYYSQGYHLAILTLLMISLGMGIKNGKINGTLLFKLALFGLFLFLLIWETRARYVYHFTPLLLLISADTYHQLVTINLKTLKQKLLFKRKKAENLSEKFAE